MPKKKIDYASMFTLRKDGRYQKCMPDGHYLYDRDPEALFRKVQAAGPRVMTFREVAEDWQVTHVEKLEESTQGTYKAPLALAIKLFGDKPVDEITAADIDRVMLSEKSDGYSYKHAAQTKSIYKQIFDRAIILEQIQYNPCTAVKVPRGLTKKSVEAPPEAMQEIIEANLDKEGSRLIAFLLYTGMRTQEIAALRWSDIDTETGTITVERAADLHGTPRIKETKTEAGNRVLPILDPLRPFCDRPKTAQPDYYVFGGRSIPSRSQLRTVYINWCRAAGLAVCEEKINRHRGQRVCVRHEWRPMINFHQFRHNYCTVCIEAELDELTTQKLMGHSDINFTKKQYATLRTKKEKIEIEKLNRHFNQKAVPVSPVSNA